MNRFTGKSTTPLTSTALQVFITDLIAEYVVQHSFKNEAEEAIEAVFSFPVPLDAAFLGMQATLGGETLVSVIQPQRQASRAYDDAIAEGDSAVLVRAPEPGVLSTSLGNLKAGESGNIELRFVTMLGVANQTARFSLPLVHRPRYGNWRLEDLDTPNHDFAVEHPMSATIRVEGLLSSSPVTSATHVARFQKKGETLELSIDQAMLDRDLVLTFELSEELPPVGRLIEDGPTNLGLISFVLPTRQETPLPLDLCVVLDGSGSMEGDAVNQCQHATRSLIDALTDQDRIQVLRFGSTVRPMFRRPLLATSRVRDALRALVPTINAELGGTEMGEALARAMAQLGSSDPKRSRAIILVTDGAVQPEDISDAMEASLEAGVRIFVVAVGSSAGTEVLRPLAEATGAVLERAVPGEPIQAGVMRQFRRAREVGPVHIDVHWPSSEALPIGGGVHYPGDAVDLAAVLPAETIGEVAIEDSSLGFSLRMSLGAATSAVALRALLGQRQYLCANSSDRADIALRYGLLTGETAAILVKEYAQGDKAESFPRVVPIPQMVPDGMVSYSLRASGGRAPPLGNVAMCAPRPTATARRGKVQVIPYKTDEASGRPILPPGYKPSPDEEYMGPLQTEYFRQRLLSWRADLVEESKQTIDNLKEEVRDVGDEAERATRETENSLELHTRDHYRKLIGKIDSTLKRVEDGEYGYSMDSGKEIGLERLEARLTAERTIDEQERWEYLQKQMEDGEQQREAGPQAEVSLPRSVTVRADRTREIFEALYSILASAWLNAPPRARPIAVAIGFLPKNLQESARKLMARCFFALDDPSESVRLLLALGRVLDMASLTDEAEANLAWTLSAVALGADDVVWDDIQLDDALRELLSEGLITP